MTLFNPLDPLNIGGTIAVELVHGDALPLDAHKPNAFEGGGVYALYYHGPCPLYLLYRWGNLHRWGEPRAVFPIYVGSSFAVGTKTGLQGVRGRVGSKYALAKRIDDHRKNILSANKKTRYPLSVSDFSYRYVPLHDTHVGLAEAILITFFRPAWNGTGFGNHIPGKGRRGKQKPNIYAFCHKLARPRKVSPAELDDRKSYRQRIKLPIKDQIWEMSRPDTTAAIEKFMQLIRLKLGLPI